MSENAPADLAPCSDRHGVQSAPVAGRRIRPGLAAMPRTPGLRLLTLVEPGTEGDERRYAAALADRLGSALAAPHFDLGTIDVTRLTLPHCPVPSALPIMQAVKAIHRREEESSPIDAFFTGNGGDNVVCNMHSAAPLADLLVEQAPTPGAWRVVRDLSDLTGSPIADVIRHGWRRLRDRRYPHPVRRDLSGLSERAAAAATAEDDRHPWLLAPPGALPGQKAYVAMQACGQKSIELYPRMSRAPQIAPLMSQPIVDRRTKGSPSGGFDPVHARGVSRRTIDRYRIDRPHGCPREYDVSRGSVPRPRFKLADVLHWMESRALW